MTRIRIEEEGREPREVEMLAPAIVGRSEDAALRIEEPRASREHAEIRPAGSGVLLTDLGSTNGTWREEQRILRERLRPGERFRIGSTWFEVVEEARAAPPRTARSLRASTIFGATAPALVLLVLVFVGVHALGASRDEEVADAMRRLALAEYRAADAIADPAERLSALEAFARKWPDSPRAAAARDRAGELGPRIERAAAARENLAELDRLRAGDGLAFDELRYRYEKLLDEYGDLPVVSDEIRRSQRSLYEAHEEALAKIVDGIREEAGALAAEGEYGRAASLLTSFARRNPVAASIGEAGLRQVEGEVMEKALHAYRDLLSRADEMARGDRREEAVALLREKAPTFNGTRFMAFLRLRAEALGGARSPGAGPKEEEDLLALRRSYYLLAREAEELAAAGLFARAAEKYAGVLETVRIASIREEFERRAAELRELAGLIDTLKAAVAERTERLGLVELGGGKYRIRSLKDDVLTLTRGPETRTREWGSLEPEEVLALFRAARLPPEKRLLVAVWCFDLNLREAFHEEILALLEDDATREEAGRIFAQKEGRPYPDGGFVAYHGRILTRAEHAEEVHREQVAKLRERQKSLYERLLEQPVFSKKLAKLKERRDELDRARDYALKLIFDEVKYFYPYRDRMGEYTPVQKEVGDRVDAVREIWNDPMTVNLKTDSTTKGILEDIAETNRELAELGVGTADFEREIRRLTVYLDHTFTVRDFFVDEVDRSVIDYSRKVMEHNATADSVARDPERAQVRITNEYRIMMGRKALVLDDRLVKSARGHCEEMSREGYFSHFSPHPERRTPDLRMKAEGYPGMPSSENIHMGSGSPEGAFNGWFHSSGHHRNMLQKVWTEMGTGQAGKYWTQNFGRTHPMPFPEDEEK